MATDRRDLSARSTDSANGIASSQGGLSRIERQIGWSPGPATSRANSGFGRLAAFSCVEPALPPQNRTTKRHSDCFKPMPPAGFEPAPRGLKGRRSNQLSYRGEGPMVNGLRET